jgi:hypothetical protein
MKEARGGGTVVVGGKMGRGKAVIFLVRGLGIHKDRSNVV